MKTQPNPSVERDRASGASPVGSTLAGIGGHGLFNLPVGRGDGAQQQQA